MRRTGLAIILCVVACLGGIAAGEFLHRARWTRDAVGRLSGRGDFVASVRGTAYFAGDLDDARALTTVLAENVRGTRAGEAASAAQIERELGLLRDQFDSDGEFVAAVEHAGSDQSSLRAAIVDHLEVRPWIEERIAAQLIATEDECRQLYAGGRAEFLQPKRYRARHLFVAAPEGTAPNVVAEKRSMAEGLAIRLLAGEAFDDLAEEASEDEATKFRGGDLGYFAAARMPPEFITELEKLAVGETSPPFRSHLGFHIVELTEMKSATELTFEQAQPEIAARIANQKRAAAVTQLSSAGRERGARK